MVPRELKLWFRGRSERPDFSVLSNCPRGGDYEGGGKRRKGKDYQVFLSFRGKDTGKGFTDYLYTSLVNAGIQVFRDDNELHDGQEVLGNITHFKVSIPIISENYTCSKWCLRELVQMLECKRSIGQTVLPIFYKVKPSSVQLIGTLEDAIDAQKENLDEMKEWKKALEEVTSLEEGWESEKIADGYEGALVKIVVNHVMSELENTGQPQLVGIDDHMEKIMRIIDDNSDGTKIIGIHGISGIGKTTFARALYENLFSRFKHLNSVANIQETECLQKQLIDDILRCSNDVSTVDEGIGVTKSRFTSEKVLIILDDMDDNTYLNALVENRSWFKAGSIIIITTKNESTLDKVGLDYKLQLEKLSFKQSLTLFSRHAFGKDYPLKYNLLSSHVVRRCRGHPLTLEVIALFLRGKNKEVWRQTSRKLRILFWTLRKLKKLKKANHEEEKVLEVEEKLRIIYEALNKGEQEIFLDVACLFIGSSKQNPIYMWNACGFLSGKYINRSSPASIIKIDEHGKLMMHDLLRDLGRKIVSQERSRLWIYKEAIDVLHNNKGTSEIQALCLDEYDYGRSYTGQQFKELTNLRFLKVCGVNFTGDFQNLLPQLRWLQWERCPSDFTVANFHPKKLVVLDLSWSEISEDWGGWGQLKMATELKVLNLTGCLSLRRTPDLSAFESLEILILKECENLEKIHSSMESLVSLTQLDLSHTWIEELPKFIGSLVSLTQLDLSHSGTEEFPEFMGSLKSLTRLDLSHSGISEFKDYMSSLVSLTQLDLSCTGIKELPKSMGSLTSLIQLDLSWTGIKELPKSIGSLTELKTLDASNCRSLYDIHFSIRNLTSLQRFLLRGCCSLRCIPDSIGKLTSLIELDLNSTAMDKLPRTVRYLQKMSILDIRGTEITRLPSQLFSVALSDHQIDWEQT